MMDHDISAFEMIQRHEHADWLEMSCESHWENIEALEYGERILSAYTYHGIKFWVITEWDRSVTTILLPEEY